MSLKNLMKSEDIKSFEHIRYTFIDGVCYRVCNPFRDAITFLIPITTPEDEYERDRAAIDSGVDILLPSISGSSTDPNELRDHFYDVTFVDKTGFPEMPPYMKSVIGNKESHVETWDDA